jgi:SAM-dependent methyltransferase
MTNQEFQGLIEQLGELSELQRSTLAMVLWSKDSIGFRISQEIIGNIDKAILHDDDSIEISGWAFDKANSSEPVTVFLFNEGSVISSQKTNGRQPDISEHFPLLQSRHVNFHVRTKTNALCSLEHKILGIAIGPSGSVGVIGHTCVIDFRGEGMRRVVERGYDTGHFEELRVNHTLTAHEKSFLDGFLCLLPAPTRVLDIGCGPGVPYDRYLVEHGCTLTGLDLSGRLISLARSNVPEANYIKEDILKANFETCFDGILSLFAIFHIPRANHENLFRLFNRSLTGRGALLITLATAEMEFVSDWWGAPMAWSSYDPEFYINLLKSLGYALIRSRHGGKLGDRHLWLLAQKS